MRKRKELGRYIVTDPEICGGELTFIGTRIPVAGVLRMISEGMSWKKIIWEYHNSITKEAISEAVQLATEALITKAGKKSNNKSLAIQYQSPKGNVSY